MKKIVIVGGVAGGASCAARLRRLDEEAHIVLLERGEYISYANCGLPYHIGDVIKSRDSLLVSTPEMMKNRFRIDVRTGNEVIAIDRKGKSVRVKARDGQEYDEPYDELVLSTGSSPLKPGIPGIETSSPENRDTENRKRTNLKRIKALTGIIALLLAALLLTACGKSEFGMAENTAKRMTIAADNADKKDFFMVGSLEVEDGEQIVVTSNLKKGSIRVELVGTPAEQSIDQLPEMNGEATLTAELTGTDGVSGTVPAGSYLLRATCLEKASGTVEIEVQPA